MDPSRRAKSSEVWQKHIQTCPCQTQHIDDKHHTHLSDIASSRGNELHHSRSDLVSYFLPHNHRSSIFPNHYLENYFWISRSVRLLNLH